MKRFLGILFALVLLFSLVGLMTSASVVQAQTTFTVNTTDDIDDGKCDATHCSLREAINAANVNMGTDTIAFNITGTDPHTIQPTSALPTITDPVIIDGYTQPGASPNTNPSGLGLNTVLMIELDGGNMGANGLHITAGNSTVRGLVINRFAGTTGTAAIRLETNGGNVIEGNFIGCDVTGTIAWGNFYGGLRISNAPNNTIGGTTPEARNLISGNTGNGAAVMIEGESAAGNMIQGNLIGTDISGTVDLGNGSQGVAIYYAPDNTIGGTTTAARNVISGNGKRLERSGVEISSSAATGNNVQGNYIGTDVTGTADLGNSKDGVTIAGAPGNTIGGTTAQARNVISGNEGGGVRINGEGATENLVQGNFIGTDATGTAAIGNSHYAGVVIEFSASNNTIGGTTAGAGNIISGNGGDGVFLYHGAGPGAMGNLVQGNYIGTDVTGTANLGNSYRGVAIAGWLASSNTIGGMTPGAGNIIAFNGDDGVFVSQGTGNAILSNSIFSNGGLGIDLGTDGVTPNDAGDGDTGANNLQNFPVLTSATTGSSITIEGTLNSTANTAFRLEFFSNSACDPSGYGEGETFLGFTNVTTDDSGNVSFAVTFPDTVTAGHFITATATDPDGNTSEFSHCVQVIALEPDIRTPIDTIDFGDVEVGSSQDETTTIYNDGSDTLTINTITRISGSAEFTYVGPSTPFDIAAGSSQAITIRFAPTSAGAKSATFNVNSNDSDDPDVTFDVSGNVIAPATIDFDPDTLNVKSKGKWITCYIEFPDGYNVQDIDIDTVMLNAIIAAETHPTEIGDYDSDGVSDLMVKFDRASVQAILEVGEQVEIIITGEVAGVSFEGVDTIRVIDNGKGK